MTDKSGTTPRITLRDQRAHLGGYNPDAFVEDPAWEQKPARVRGRKSRLAVALFGIFALLALLRRLGVFQLLSAHPAASHLPSFTHFHI